ncbi:MAG: hypothetical protein BM560_07040 [Roseobacter sp. MedPE-SWde]|nr:MAG: hypothetical protein BM560_07040 [Roseobacter sp. MedPE-SWde]
MIGTAKQALPRSSSGGKATPPAPWARQRACRRAALARHVAPHRAMRGAMPNRAYGSLLPFCLGGSPPFFLPKRSRPFFFWQVCHLCAPI